MIFFKKLENLSYFVIIFALTLLLSSCSSLFKEKKDPVTEKKEIWEPNSDARARKHADENPVIIFGDKNKKNSSQDSEFGTSNVLWRATLKSLDFLPLINSDYRGGIIIYDWYSVDNNPKEQIKISVQFLSNELKSDSIKITAHKRTCKTVEGCSSSTIDQNFASSIKDSIINSARTLKVEEAKNQKK